MAGLPEDSRSSFRRGAAQAPERIRRAYDGRCFNSCSESGRDLAGRVIDLGDWAPAAGWEATRESYREGASWLLQAGAVPFFMGGDHAVTIPLGEALGVLARPVHVIQIDAHPDLYPDYEGDRFSHACTALRLLELEHIASLTQIGVRAFNPLQREQAIRWGERLKVIEARHLSQASSDSGGKPAANAAETAGSNPVRGPLQESAAHPQAGTGINCLPYPDWIPAGAMVYLTLDIDALDPAYAPGVSHPVPGGLNTRQVLDWLIGFPWKLAGMDLVEVNPSRDINDLTAIAAARLLHEAMAKALHGPEADGPRPLMERPPIR